VCLPAVVAGPRVPEWGCMHETWRAAKPTVVQHFAGGRRGGKKRSLGGVCGGGQCGGKQGVSLGGLTGKRRQSGKQRKEHTEGT
jgi:hypothetical protein